MSGAAGPVGAPPAATNGAQEEGAPVGAAVDPASATAELGATGPAIRRGVPLDAPFAWLRAGWADFRRAPRYSLMVAAVCILVSWLLVLGVAMLDYAILILPLTAGFMFCAPILAVGLYEGSRRIEAGEPPGYGATAAAFRRNRGGIAFMGILLLMFLYGWLRVATMLFALFFGLAAPPLEQILSRAFLSPDTILYGAIGTGIGAMLAAIVFGLSAVSLPMLVDRRVDAVTAAATSMRAVLANPMTALVWAGLIVVITFLAALPGFLGFLVAVPLIGHATWHAYRALVVPAETP
jgi:uncharacterized membrane protein